MKWNEYVQIRAASMVSTWGIKLKNFFFIEEFYKNCKVMNKNR